ncbi:hypothetical protein H6796_02725 [Candidatus Nomurabacteria bacterium]|nr:hypothetical protein [Candidatus Nomurabacteria bacterium]
MGLYLKQESQRSKLQERVAADLAEKARQRAAADNDSPDGVADSAYMKDKKVTTSLGLVWVIVAIAAVAILIWLAVASM